MNTCLYQFEILSKSKETFPTTSTFITSTIYTTTTASIELLIKTKQTRNPGNISSVAGPNKAIRQILGNLSSSSGISNLVAITIIDITTGQTTFIDENDNSLTQEQVNIQNTACTALENIPEITIEDILVECSENNKTEALVTSNNKSDSPIGGMDSTDKGFLIDLTEPSTKKVKKSKASISKKCKASVDSKDSDNKETEDEGDSDHSKGGQTSIKTPVTTRRHTVPSSSHCIKHWSETKSWQKILNTELKEQCPTDIDKLVGNTVREVGKPLRSSYKAKIIQLKARGFDNKVAQVAGLNIQVTIMED
jgi:hypothetical protein